VLNRKYMKHAARKAVQEMAKTSSTAPVFNRGSCSTCGKPLIWSENFETKKRVPLDPLPLVYAVRMNNGQCVSLPARKWLDLRNERMRVLRDKVINANLMSAEEFDKLQLNSDGIAFYVTHFATCPQASQHSRGGE
jgi:hypothetical protein